MALIESQSEVASSLQGLHLYHFAMSNCSQRVRLALAEKGLAWTSHHVNIATGEQLSASYRRIHPAGLVPALVDDGQVIIESNDIIDYLDQHFPGPALAATDLHQRRRQQALMQLAAERQAAIKVLSHELLFKGFRSVSQDEIDRLGDGNAELLSFLLDYREDGAAWQQRVATARDAMHSSLAQLEQQLRDTPYLSGDVPYLSGNAFGLADISWIVNLYRLEQCRYDLTAYPALQSWSKKIQQRPSFSTAISEYQP